jgi:hypothetical protein
MLFADSTAQNQRRNRIGTLMFSVANVFKAIKALTTRRVHIECDRIPYDFDDVPLKKTLDWMMIEASCWYGRKNPGDGQHTFKSSLRHSVMYDVSFALLRRA